MGAKLSFEVQEAIRLLDTGLTCAQAAKTAGVTVSALMRHLKRIGRLTPTELKFLERYTRRQAQ